MPGIIFHEPFINNIAFFTSSSGLSWTGSGPSGHPGIQLTPSGTSPRWGMKTHAALTTQTDARFGGVIDVNTLAIPSGGNIGFFLWRTSGGTQRVKLQIYNSSGTLQIIHTLRGDDGLVSQAFVSLGGATAFLWELWINKTSGESRLYWDTGSGLGAAKDIRTKVITNTFDDQTEIYYGALDNPSSGITGTLLLGPLAFSDDSAEIGAYQYATPPTVSDISNQTGTVGTQKTVACTIGDLDSDIVRCDVSTNGNSLITLTASGAATITDNGTSHPYVTGSHADILATLGNDIKLGIDSIWPSLEESETVTVLVTDSLGFTDSDSFLMTWSIPTGIGTSALHLTGDKTEINAALATVELTPPTDYTGIIQCLMYSKNSALQDDTDIFQINVGAPAPNNDPVILVPGLELATVDVWKFIIGVVVNDIDDNLSKIRIQCTGGIADVSLVLTEVVAGSKPGTDFTIQGTQDNLNTTIGALIYLGVELGLQSITLTATDTSEAEVSAVIDIFVAISRAVQGRTSGGVLAGVLQGVT